MWQSRLHKLLMNWNPIEISAETQFSEVSTAQAIQEKYAHKDLEGLYKMALLLNQMAHQQRTMAKWLAKEAASNLTRQTELSS